MLLLLDIPISLGNHDWHYEGMEGSMDSLSDANDLVQELRIKMEFKAFEIANN